jgi:deoxyhypusine synthase
MVHISKTLESLDTESRQLDEVLLQNWNIRKDIINRLKDTIIQADYYEQFEKVLSVIIEQLNTLNSRLNKETNHRDKSDKVKNLKEIENYYTVASERIIHQKVIDEDTEIIVPEKSDSEEDMELF